MGLIERSGESRACKMERLTAETMQAEVRANVRKWAILMTDEAKGYRDLKGDYHHHSVEHGVGKYMQYYSIHTDSLENAWSLSERQVFGIHHLITLRHLDRFPSEFTFWFNRRDMSEGNRVDALIANAIGRLTYTALVI